MSLIALELPSRDKAAAEAGGERPAAEWNFALAADGSRLSQQGAAALALLPKADRLVLVAPPQELAWHSVRCPKAAAHKMRAALGWLLEDALLADDDSTHLALWGPAVAGRDVWVAALDRTWLRRTLATLEAAGLHADALVPALAPGLPGRGQVLGDAQGSTFAVLADELGVRCLPVEGSLARALVQARLTGQAPGAAGEASVTDGVPLDTRVLPAGAEPQAIAWTTHPAAAAAAERWLGHPVPLMSDGERLLAAALEASGNLLQFDLQPRQRGLRVLRDAVASWRTPRWRWLRWGLVGTLLVNLVGLNAAAWQQRQAVAERQQAQVDVLKASFPGVRAVLDAPLQMRAEAERARAASGRIGSGDFEALLGALAGAWPEGAAPLPAVNYEPGRLLLAAGSVPEPMLPALRTRLQAAGMQLVPGEAPGSWLVRPQPGVLEVRR